MKAGDHGNGGLNTHIYQCIGDQTRYINLLDEEICRHATLVYLGYVNSILLSIYGQHIKSVYISNEPIVVDCLTLVLR